MFISTLTLYLDFMESTWLHSFCQRGLSVARGWQVFLHLVSSFLTGKNFRAINDNERELIGILYLIKVITVYYHFYQ